MPPRDALEMFDRCHRQLEAQLDALADAAGQLAAGTGDRATLWQLRDVGDYFERSAPRHVADEEESLFPRLGKRVKVVATLIAQHREHDRLHAELAALLERIERPCPPALGAELAALADRMRKAYTEHIELEDRLLMPRLPALLSAAELDQLLVEMRARRGKGSGRGGGGGGGGGAKKRARA